MRRIINNRTNSPSRIVVYLTRRRRRRRLHCDARRRVSVLSRLASRLHTAAEAAVARGAVLE